MRTKQKLAQTRAGRTRGLGSRSRRHRPPRERWEEARGGRRPRPTMEDPSPDDAGQKTVRRSRRAGRDEGGSRTLRRSAGGCTKRLGAAGTRGTMWKTASASPPSGGRPRLVADHTHKVVPFYPSDSREVSVFPAPVPNPKSFQVWTINSYRDMAAQSLRPVTKVMHVLGARLSWNPAL